MLTAAIIDSPVAVAVVDGFATHSCTGWVGTGSVPAFGVGTNTGSFTLNEDSSVTWLWELTDLVLSNFLETGVITHDATRNIRAGDGYYVVPPGNVTLEAGREIRLTDGFQATSGSTFRAVIQP
jgi:hypothetical protein